MSGIDVLPNTEQEHLKDAVTRVLDKRFPVSRLGHGHRAATLSADDWAVVREAGWIGLSLPMDQCGVGYQLTESALLHRVSGAHLLSPNLAATTVAAKIAADTGDEALCAALVAGTAHAAFAVLRTQGASQGQCHLIDHQGATLLMLLTPDGARLLPPGAAGQIVPVEAMDSTVPLVQARIATADLERPVDPVAGLWARVLIGAELAGLAVATARLSADYAKIRQQFGKPIGTFQAVAHPCADSAMRAEAAVAQSIFSSIAVRDERSDAGFHAAAACLIASDAAFRNATANIQIHGGMGFSAESDAHLYLKRAILLRSLVGGDASHREPLLQGAPVLE